MQRSKTLWVLVAFFTWAALKSAGSIYGAESFTDYALLSSVGMGALFYIFTAPIMLGEATVAILLFKQKATAYVAGLVVIIAECVNGTVTSAVFALNSDTAKSFYMASREARGMSARDPSELQFMFSPAGVGLMALAYLALWAVVFYYLRKVKPELTQ